MSEILQNSVNWVTIDEGSEGQRIDNFLTKILKGVPKNHLYRILRSGEVRVNSKRVDATYKLVLNDLIRIPPVTHTAKPAVHVSVPTRLDGVIIYEDEALIAIDKPAGMAVHGGSGISRGVIEQLRAERPKSKFLELVHRLDRETSGVLLIAKKRSALVAMHDMMRNNQVEKRYLMLVKGAWKDKKRRVRLDLIKHEAPNGDRRVSVGEGGQPSDTIFHLRENFHLAATSEDYTLLEAELITGRTHQLRVQLAHLGFPILGDDKYGDYTLNKILQKHGLKRMFLHSFDTRIQHPLTAEPLAFSAPLPAPLKQFIQFLKA